MIDENTFKKIYSYCESVSDEHSQLLHDLYRETHLKTLAPRMASGPIQGRFLSLLCKLLCPNRILEIGTFTGFATLCMAEGLPSNGHIDTIEVNGELSHISDKYFVQGGVRSQITSHVGDAREIVKSLEGPYDLIFIDAKKQDYSLADNVLWDGKVYSDAKDATTRSLKEFNQKVKDDLRIETLLLPLRDGLTIMRKEDTKN